MRREFLIRQAGLRAPSALNTVGVRDPTRRAVTLQLEILDYGGPDAWRWRLTEEPGGGFLADEEVRLDGEGWQREAFADLDDYLRWHAAPDRRAQSEAELVDAVGSWVGARVLGRVGEAMVEHAPVAVRLKVPVGAEVLAYRPLELGWVNGRPVGAQGVSLVIELAGGRSRAWHEVGDRLRMLAVFSLPDGTSALNLRRERVGLSRLVQEIAKVNGRAVELRVLQYGVTRERLQEVMDEDEGWDVVHISGHGLPAGLLLEQEDGGDDLVSSTELVELLEPAAERVKLVLLSSCESAAVTAAEHLRQLGIEPPESLSDELKLVRSGGNGVPILPALAAELVRQLDCAVVAMRYPVGDEFAITLATELYSLVLGKRRPLPRALAMALPRVLAATRDAPPISVATPALFGARAMELKLAVPAGAPVVFGTQKLAGFKPQPRRFVGRVGTMARATEALAPRSGETGVLFHGMAGAGKTACALELAYTHEHSFGRLVWHEAPAEDEDLRSALSRFATDLEAQLPGMQMVHLIDDRQRLRGFLPTLSKFMAEERVLILLDNCESLLTDAGDWRDERWGDVVTALSAHDGLSRLVMTSRRRPRVLPDEMLVEAVHALSATEAVLLAREWPHLRALLDSATDEDRRLAARTLVMVQGHPKLMELADGQAADPAVLRQRLDDADGTWLNAGVSTGEFLERGESPATAEDYLRVLEGWSRATAAALPEGSRLLFEVISCLEHEDRVEPVVGHNWPEIWRALGRPGELPDVEAAVGPLSDQALVAVEREPDGRPGAYHLHPAISATGRDDAPDEVREAVDRRMIAYWVSIVRSGLERENENLGPLLLRAARAAMPYLARQQDWSTLLLMSETVYERDQSPQTAAEMLPTLRVVATAAEDEGDKLGARREVARALFRLRPTDAEAEFRALITDAEKLGDLVAAMAVATDLITLLRETARFDEALQLVDQVKDYATKLEVGPWTRLSGEGQRLQIRAMMGHAEEVLEGVEELRRQMAELPEEGTERETVNVFNVREGILDTGHTAALELRRWEEAIALTKENLESKERRGADALAFARTEFGDYSALLGLGRYEDARTLVLNCRRVFEQEKDLKGLEQALTALAALEKAFGRHDQAARLEIDSLRLCYAIDGPHDIGVSHANVGLYLDRLEGGSREALGHRLAAAVIAYQTSSGALVRRLRILAPHVAEADDLPDWDEVCDLVSRRTEGVDLAGLLPRLPAKAKDGPAALAEVIRLAREIPPEEEFDSDAYIAGWDPLLSALVAAAGGDEHAAQVLEEALEQLSATGSALAIIRALRRIAEGARGPELLAGLDELDTAIAQRTLDALAGEAEIDPTAWHALAVELNERELLEHLRTLASGVVAAVHDEEMAAVVRPMLDDMAQVEEFSALAEALRRILAGERDPSLRDGLDAKGAAVVETVLEVLAEEP
jgi:hypothetical protein